MQINITRQLNTALVSHHLYSITREVGRRIETSLKYTEIYLLNMMKIQTKIVTSAPVARVLFPITGDGSAKLQSSPVQYCGHKHLKEPFVFTHVALPKHLSSWHSSMSTHFDKNFL